MKVVFGVPYPSSHLSTGSECGQEGTRCSGGGNPRQRHTLLTCVCVCVCYVLDTKSCSTLCDPMDCSLPGSSVHGILQARILEWVATPFSRGFSRTRDQTWVSCTGMWVLYCLRHQGSPVLTSVNLALHTQSTHISP